MRALLPVQQKISPTVFFDRSGMGLHGTVGLWEILRYGWTRPPKGKYRIWHSRRPLDQLLGLALKYVLLQPWKLVYTSPSPRRHGWFWRAVVNRSSAIIAVTPNAASFLDWHTKIIPHGVDVNDFTPSKNGSLAWREGGLTGKYGIGIFGRIRPDKGTDLFVSAMCEFLPRHPEFTAVISGLCKPNHRNFFDALVQQIKRAGLEKRILFLGDLSVEEIKLWFQRISLCVAVPRSEGFGLTPLEAMSSGTAALTSSEGYFPQMIVPGLNGDIVPTDNVTALLHALDDLCGNPESLLELGKQARAYVEKHHSIDREAKEIQDLYDEVLSQQS